jgi:glycosyltransferase involved in cell wall biosynthesis
MPKVSVCIPSYNHEKYVRAAIESVLEQSFQDFEILVTDDGSTDRTVGELQAIQDKRLSLEVLPQNRGACIALNASIKRGTGEFVAVLNSDDIFLPGKLERQVRFLESRPDVGAVFGYPAFMDENGGSLREDQTFYRETFRVENRSQGQWLRQFFLRGNVLCHPTIVIRRRCYDDVGYYDPALAQLPDLDMWVRLVQRHSIHVLPEPLIGFRILRDNMNASAPRQEVIVRLNWEWRRILEHYAALHDRLLVEAFPEVARRLEGAPADNEAAIPARRGRPALWCLAERALHVGRSPHICFAFDAMYRVLTSHNAPPECYREFINYTGSFDPFGLASDQSPIRRLR